MCTLVVLLQNYAIRSDLLILWCFCYMRRHIYISKKKFIYSLFKLSRRVIVIRNRYITAFSLVEGISYSWLIQLLGESFIEDLYSRIICTNLWCKYVFECVDLPGSWISQNLNGFTGADPRGGGATGARPALKLEKIWFFGVKPWFFTRNTPKIFAPLSARRNFIKCAPPNLKSCILPCFRWYC